MQPPYQQPYYPPPPQPRRGPPAWVWALIGCGCLFPLIILPAILFPVFAQARHAARSAACMSNLKQSGLAMMMYAQDYDQRLPRAAEWMDAAGPYIKQEYVLHCPEVSSAKTGYYGYAYDSKLDKANLSDLKSPETTILIYDSSNLSRNATDAVTSLPSPVRHRRGNNVAFANGAVRPMSSEGASPASD